MGGDLPWRLNYCKFDDPQLCKYDPATRTKNSGGIPAARLDKTFGGGVDEIASLLLDKNLSLEYKASLLQLALLRGRSYPRKTDAQIAVDWLYHDGPSPEEYAEAMKYQELVVKTILEGGDPRLFHLMCAPNVQEHLSKGTPRFAATQLFHILMQKGGWADSDEGRSDIKNWLLALDPETRGRAVWHVGNAMVNGDIGQKSGGGLTGFEVSVGNEGLEFGIGMQWEPEKVADSHWRGVGEALINPVMWTLHPNPDDPSGTHAGDPMYREKKEWTEEDWKKQRREFYEGYLAADPSHDPKDLRQE